jgi:hypothetical protein
MFNLLDGVLRTVSDALAAASMSSAESASRSIHCVSLEIDKTFHEVPPSVKNALAAAISSVGATCEENLATLYLCFGDEFDKIKKEHEHSIAEIKSENRSLKLRLEHQSNQSNILLAKQRTQQTSVSRMYQQTNNFAQTVPGCDRNDNHSDQKMASTLATHFSSHREASTNKEALPASAAMVNQQVEVQIEDRRYHQSLNIRETQTERNQKHHHHQRSSRTIIQRTGAMLSFFPESSSKSLTPSIAEQTYKHVWNQSFHELSEYKKRFGNCNVPLTFSENPSLGIWVSDVSSFMAMFNLCIKVIRFTKNHD